MKRLFLILSLLTIANLGLKAQNVYICKNPAISFYSSAPLEDIEAVNNKGVSAINFDNNKVYFKVKIKDFKFENSLMQEHFNENYMESDKYPNAIFSGVLSSKVNPKKDGVQKVKCSGELEIHGVKKKYTTTVNFLVKNRKVKATTSFNVNLEDHGIDIPKIAIKKIAETVEVKVDALYEKKE